MGDWIAVSMNATKQYRDALSHVARLRKQKVGEMVKAAVDEKYGNEIEMVMSLFFETSGKSTDHSDTQQTDLVAADQQQAQVHESEPSPQP